MKLSDLNSIADEANDLEDPEGQIRQTGLYHPLHPNMLLRGKAIRVSLLPPRGLMKC